MTDLTHEFAESCLSSKEEIVEAWSASVRSDPLLKADDALSYDDFIDFIPAILDEICGRISATAAGEELDLERSGGVHGAFRWEKGYNLAEVVREIGHLRQVLLDRVAEVGEMTGASPSEQRELTRTILRLLDEIEIAGVQTFIARRDGELAERIRKMRDELE